jgi:predicted transcriptional regulator
MRRLRRRDKEEIIYEILRAAQVPTTKTRLIYRSYLSGTEVNEYIRLLIQRNMLRFNELGTRLVITNEGKRFMQIYENMQIISMSNL